MRTGRQVSMVLVMALALAHSTAASSAADQTFREAAARVGEPFRLLDEIRVGVSGVSAFDESRSEYGFGGEVLTSRIIVGSGNRLVDLIFGPRLHAGGMADLGGGPDYAYAGFTWTVPVTESLFVEAAFGGAVNDQGGSGELGCAFTFREAAAVGYTIADHWNVTLGIEHLSHAKLCGDQNGGITNVGAKVGYRF